VSGKPVAVQLVGGASVGFGVNHSCSESAKIVEQAKPIYLLPRDDLVGEVLIPAFSCARKAECMVGYFSSAVLADLAPGLATFIQRVSAPFRLIVSPYLSIQDQQALTDGTLSSDAVAAQVLENFTVTENELQEHTLRCLSYLLKTGRLEFKVALMKAGLFHQKVWLFDVDCGKLAVHGSSNMTHSGVCVNKEQASVSKSWMEPSQQYVVQRLEQEFDVLWGGKADDCVVVDIPDAIRHNLLKVQSSEAIPSEEDFSHLYQKAIEISDGLNPGDKLLPEARIEPPPSFAIPSGLEYKTGPFAHQGQAVDAWIQSGGRGTLEMATGSGKTITSMICAHKLFKEHERLLVVVAAPYLPLIGQWCDEIRQFGIEPLNLTKCCGAVERSQMMGRVRRRLSLGLSKVEAVVVSHDTLCNGDFQSTLKNCSCPRFLIADEAHNLGRASFLTNTPDLFEYRLALSATPIRQYDPDGTEEIFKFFGPIVFSFPLEKAIGLCLVGYDYFIHPVELTSSEMEEWRVLSEIIRKNAWRNKESGPDDFLARKLMDRRLLLEKAEGKIRELARLLALEDLTTLRHTIIYATDKGRDQLDSVNTLLSRNGLLFHQLTAEETRDQSRTREIIGAFQSGNIQVITAKRVLDEGVNIPQICRAYILASTTVERQWIQRRGRLLRRCSEIGKTHAIIHDFIAIPPASEAEHLDKDARSLIESELKRVEAFARLARNAGKSDGPMLFVSGLIRRLFG